MFDFEIKLMVAPTTGNDILRFENCKIGKIEFGSDQWIRITRINY